MLESETSPFEQLLESVDLTVRRTRRITLLRHQRFTTVPGESALVYLDAGELRSAPAASCAIDGAPGGAVFSPPPAHHSSIASGSALVTLGRRAISFEAVSDATLIVVSLDLTETAHRLHQLLPDPLTMIGFDDRDPAVAALASNMGRREAAGETGGSGAACAPRTGDSVICRLMARTLLLSVLRAWYSAGCAPQNWDARAADPHLDRVLRAMHEDPGHDWSLDTLAALGAMSRSAFARRFREMLGASPGQYLVGVRMEDAKRRLATGASVSQTSRDLGYASDEGFSRAFRRHTGVQPSRWRSGSGQLVLDPV